MLSLIFAHVVTPGFAIGSGAKVFSDFRTLLKFSLVANTDPLNVSIVKQYFELWQIVRRNVVAPSLQRIYCGYLAHMFSPE